MNLPEDTTIDSDFVELWKLGPCDGPGAYSLSTIPIKLWKTCAPIDFMLLDTGLMVVRARWIAWIEEAKTELAVCEGPGRGGDIRDGGTTHEESPVQNVDIVHANSVHEGMAIRSRLGAKTIGGFLHDEAPICIGDVAVGEDAMFGKKIPEREVVQVEEESDGGRDMDLSVESGDDLVFNAGERGHRKGNPRMGDTVANVLGAQDRILILSELPDDKSFGTASISKKTLGRRGRPPGRSHLLANSMKPHMGDTVANVLVTRDKNLILSKLSDRKSLGKASIPKKTPGRRGRPPGRSHLLSNSMTPSSEGN